MIRFMVSALGITIGLAGGTLPALGADDATDFDARVAPILARRCLDCHSGADPKGGLDLSRRESAMRGGESGDVVAPGKLDESLLWEHVAGGTMPPKAKMPEAEKGVIREWIEGGARWGTSPIDAYRITSDKRAGRDWWSLRPVGSVTPPAVKDASWGINPIDAFVLKGLEERGLRPAPPADRRTLIRRVSFDLRGLPPTPEEVDAFEGDVRPDAYERLVDQMLASPAYGVRWARHWLDLARYGDSNGFEYDEHRPHAWRYRDWVITSLNRDMPYDEFARRQLAGDVLRPEDPEAVEATGFLVAGAYDTVGQKQQSEAMRKVVRQDELEDIIGTVGQTFLGLTIHCARCHDHKFDPIPQVDYYRLAASLAGVRQGERDLTGLLPEVQSAKRRIAELTDRVATIERPVRERILKERSGNAVSAPQALARWDFREKETDQLGTLNGSRFGSARLERDGLRLDGKNAYLVFAPLTRDLTAKTLEAWVQLDNLDQRGGGVIGVQATTGGAYDAIVFGEREPRRWMAGSNGGSKRTRVFQGPEEHDADKRVVHVAIVYSEDGTITGYRDGQRYGESYRSPGPYRFRAGEAQILIGLRQLPVAPDRSLAGVVVRAALYDRALSPEEVAASAAAPDRFVTPEVIAAELKPEPRAERAQWLEEIATARAAIARRTRKTHAVAPRPPEAVHRLTRGNPGQPAEAVAAGGLSALAAFPADFGLGTDAPDGERRTRLAAWMSDERNPLFARVIVNRLWQGHFGAGLVETPSDFGFNGTRPSHPELLDWLAGSLVAEGWSLKAIHRVIVTSATYRQSSRGAAGAAKVDSANRWLWRKAPLRLEAEGVRDALLAVSGELNPALGGPGFREFVQPVGTGNRVMGRPEAVEPLGPEFARRTIYRTWSRGVRSGFLEAFDCPDPSTTTPRRAVTTTPLQALTLLNNMLTLHLADRFAERLTQEAGADPGRQVDRAYRLAFGRVPDQAERQEAIGVVVAHGAAALGRALFNTSEFLYID